MNLFVTLILTFNLVKDWYVIETTHFNIYYYNEVSDFALRAASFLETEVYPKVTQILEMPLTRETSVIIADIDDVGNGFAIEIFDLIFVYTADIYYVPLRGRHPWLQDVLTHEFAHVVALRKVRKTPQSVPAFGISSGIFCILEQFCKISGDLREKSTLVGGVSVMYVPYSEPAYFTEGIAQLVTSELGYDSLDSYRDMMIRPLFYYNKLYPIAKLGNFSAKTAWEGEIVYNHGFSFLTFIREKYGWGAIRKAIEYASGTFVFSYESAFKYAMGKDLEKLEEEWKEWLLKRYSDQIRRYEIGKGKGMVGEILPLERQKAGLYRAGIYWISQPKFFKDGFLVIQDGTLMYYPSFSTSSPQKLGKIQSYSVSGTHIAFSYRKPMKKFLLGGAIQQEYFQLAVGYLVEEEKGRETKLTIKDKKDVSLRASFPAFSPDLSKIVYVKTEEDSRNLFMYDIKENKEERMTNFKGGKQFMFPSFSSDGRYIIASYFDGLKQDIVLIDSDRRDIASESEMIFITNDTAEDRDPVFISENQVLFSSNSDGVFNLYIYNLETKEVLKITEELSGALFPNFISGNVLYVSFEPEGFRVKKLAVIQPQIKPADFREEEGGALNPPKGVEPADYSADNVPTAAQNYDYKQSHSRNIRRARILELTYPIFFYEVGVPLVPLLTPSSSNFFLPLDLIGITIGGSTFDKLGRLGLNGQGFIGLRGSSYIQANVDSFHFEHFIPGLGLRASRYRVMPIAETTESQAWTYSGLSGFGYVSIPLIYGSSSRSLNLFIEGVGELYSASVKVGGFTFIPFSQSFLARSARMLIGANGVISFQALAGTFSVGSFLVGSPFLTTIEESAEQFGEEIKFSEERYTASQVYGGILLSYAIPVDYEKNFTIATQLLGGYSFENVEFFDEFRDSYLGYLQVFFGDIFSEWSSLLLLDVWAGYLNLFRTAALHKISLIGFFNTFRFAQRGERLFKGFCSEDGYWCSLSFGVQFLASVLYRYGLMFYLIGSHGFQDPLKAPFRLYLGVGIEF